jgi:putative (di)nucleoside polyphosphate hydrolase
MIINRHGFRLNVGIIVSGQDNKLLWCRRIGQPDAWQFPQGGIQINETVKDAMFRELKEELGLNPQDVKCLFVTPKWLYYRLPEKYHNYQRKPYCIGQKQKWFLLRLVSNENKLILNHASSPEFDQWCWVDYWYPIDHVIPFKKQVYKKALHFFARKLNIMDN